MENQKSLSYAAGIFDVRGSLLLKRTGVSRVLKAIVVRLKVTERKWAVLDFLHQEFGGCITVSNYDELGEIGAKEWVITNNPAKEFLNKLYPYLKTKRRKQQIEILLQYQPHIPYHRYTPEERKARKRLEIRYKNLCRKLKPNS